MNPNDQNADWVARDLDVLWHPCTQMRDHPHPLPLLPIVRASGCWLEDANGQRYLDAVSSWWVNLFGHGHPRIAEAIAHQASQLDHVLLAGFTHPPAVELAEQLCELLGRAPRAGQWSPVGPRLSRVFYAEAGSAAIEIALKLSWHYWRNVGQHRRTRFVVLEQAYHGETLGALALSQMDLYRQAYGGLLLQPLVARSPASPDPHGESAERCAEIALAQMADLLGEHAGEVCAVVIEPLVQCAGGMQMHSPAYLRGLRALCDQHQVHLIADEIAVGLGRTGTLLACDQAAIRPDLLCIGKGLTGGTLPLAAVLTHDELYQAFLGEYGSGRAFLHSHSYTGFAIGCAAALAALTLLRETQASGRLQTLGESLERAFAPLARHRHVRDLRRCGNIVAMELHCGDAQQRPYPAAERRGLAVYREALRRGVLLRPLGDTLYALPPLSISDDEIRLLASVAEQAIDAACD